MKKLLSSILLIVIFFFAITVFGQPGHGKLPPGQAKKMGYVVTNTGAVPVTVQTTHVHKTNVPKGRAVGWWKNHRRVRVRTTTQTVHVPNGTVTGTVSAPHGAVVITKH